ncbi:MAG: amidohydrolase [candidate division WOR-3 bacterium]
MKYLVTAKKIYSINKNNDVYHWMLIDDGMIKELSSTALPSLLDKISFSDNYIMPGFIDSHTHILGVGLQKIFPEVSDIQSLEELFDRVFAAYNLAQELKYLIVYNFDPDNIKEKRYPTKKELDKILKKYPILIYRIDGHSAVLNSSGLNEVLTNYGDSSQSGIEVDQYKEPTGVLRGEVFELASRIFIKKIDPALRIESFFKASELAIQQGVTTMVTMVGSELDNLTCELLVANSSRLPIEVIPFYQTRDIQRVQRLNLPRIGGCILIDGSFGSHTAALNEPYADKPNHYGILYYSDQELEEFYLNADTNNLQTAVHAIGDRAIKQVIKVVKHCLKDNHNRHRIEHCELLTDALIDEISKLNLIICVQPAFEFYWGGPNKMYAERLGQRWQNTNPYRKLIEKGIIIAGGSDAPITPINPLLGISTAANMPNPEHSITLQEALKMFTCNGAYAIQAENRIGSLSIGADADFIVLEKDPLATTDNKIIAVFKKGKRLL